MQHQSQSNPTKLHFTQMYHNHTLPGVSPLQSSSLWFNRGDCSSASAVSTIISRLQIGHNRRRFVNHGVLSKINNDIILGCVCTCKIHEIHDHKGV